MNLRTTAWQGVQAIRAFDRAVTRREGRRDVLIDSRTAMNYVMAAPIQAAMATDTRVRFYATASAAGSGWRQTLARSLPGTRLISPRAATLRRFDAYLTADLLWLPLPRGTRRIQVFHGVAGKFSHDYDSPTSSMRRWDRFFFVNRRRLQNFVRAGAVDPTSQALRLVGMPKVDCLVDGSLKRELVLRRLGLDPSRPTVLYAPTWSAASSLNLIGMSLIDELLARPWNVIVKLHDRSRDPRPFYSGGVDWPARIAATMSGRTGHLASDADICPYLSASDVMITDHSSAGFEYLLLDRPLVRIHVPELLRGSNVASEYVELLAGAATTVRDPGEAAAAVEDGLADPGANSRARQAVGADLFYGPGTATARAVHELYETVELRPLPTLTSSRTVM